MFQAEIAGGRLTPSNEFPSAGDNSYVEVLIADGHEPFRRSLRSAVESRPDCRVCGEAANSSEVLGKARRLRPDVIIINSAMPLFRELQAANELHRDLPEMTVITVNHEANGAPGSESGSHTDYARTQTTERDLNHLAATLGWIAEGKRSRESGLDKTLADTFPCSDPLSSIPNPHLQGW